MKLIVSRLLVVDTFSLSIPLVDDAVHSGPPSEAISSMMPRVVWLVLRAGMSPWAVDGHPCRVTGADDGEPPVTLDQVVDGVGGVLHVKVEGGKGGHGCGCDALLCLPAGHCVRSVGLNF